MLNISNLLFNIVIYGIITYYFLTMFLETSGPFNIFHIIRKSAGNIYLPIYNYFYETDNEDDPGIEIITGYKYVGSKNKLAELLVCPYCLSFWIAILLIISGHLSVLEAFGSVAVAMLIYKHLGGTDGDDNRLRSW